MCLHVCMSLSGNNTHSNMSNNIPEIYHLWKTILRIFFPPRHL